MQIVYDLQTTLDGYTYQKMYQVASQNKVSYYFQIQIYDEFHHVHLYNITINNQKILADKLNDQVLFHILPKTTPTPSSNAGSSSSDGSTSNSGGSTSNSGGSTSNSGGSGFGSFWGRSLLGVTSTAKTTSSGQDSRNILLENIQINKCRFQNYQFLKLVYSSKSEQTNIQLNNIGFNDTVIKDIQYFIEIDQINESNFTHFKVQDMIVNSMILQFYAQNKVIFNTVSFQNVTNDIQIIGVDFFQTQPQNIYFWDVKTVDLKTVVLNQLNIISKQEEFIKIMNSQGKLSGFVLTNNRMLDDLIHIRSTSQTDKIELDGFKVQNNSVTNYGTFYISTIRLDMNNSQFYNNSGKRGASMYNYNVDLRLNNSVFRLNNSTDNMYGGQFYFYSGKSSISNSEFHTSKVSERGAAIYNLYHSQSVNNVTCQHNVATKRAGCLYFYKSTANLENLKCLNNECTDRGGCIYSWSSTVNIFNSNFYQNNAQNGAAVYLYLPISGVMTNNTIKENRFQSHGTIYSIQSKEPYQQLQFINNNFYNNSGKTYGSGLYGYKTNFSVVNNTFNKNVVENNGAAIAILDGYLSILDSHLINNTALESGVLYSKDSQLIIANCKFIENKSNKGAALSFVIVNVKVILLLQDSKIQKNMATKNGGAIFLDNAKKLDTGFIIIKNNSFISNQAILNGGVIDSTFFKIDLKDNQFTSNKANENGGAIQMYEGILKLTRVNFSQQLSEQKGGSIFLKNSECYINNCSFSNDSAILGGSILSEVSTIQIQDTNFKFNRAIKEGGSFSFFNSKTTIHRCNFQKDTAFINGGSIYAEQSQQVQIINCSFTDCTAYQKGGAFYLQSNSFTFKNVSFINNVAKEIGGVFFQEKGQLEFTNCQFENNSGFYSGVMESYSSQINIYNSSLINNTAFQSVGAIHILQDSILNLQNSTLSLNKARTIGVFRLSTRSQMNIRNCSFQRNQEQIVEQSKSKVNIHDSIFLNNTAQRGCLCQQSQSSTFQIKNSQIKGNQNLENGAIVSQSSSIEISDTLFQNNTANKYGSIIYSQSDHFNLLNSTFKDNNSSQFGAAIYAQKTVIHIKNCVFENHNSQIGTLYVVQSQSVQIVNSKFMNNNANVRAACIYSYQSFVDLDFSEFKNNKGNEAGCIFMQKGQLSMSNSQFSKQYSQQNGSCLSFNQSNNAIKNCKFEENRAEQNGGVLFGIGSNTQIQNSQFKHSKAMFGGAIYNQDGQFQIKDCLIERSEAIKIGGALYLIFSTQSNNIYNIERVQFNSNIAYIAASVYFSKITHIYFKNNVFNSNQAQLHSNYIFSYPCNMIFEIEEQNKIVKVETFGSNEFILKDFGSIINKNYKLKFKFLNKEGEVVSDFENPIYQSDVQIYIYSTYNESSCNVQNKDTRINYDMNNLKYDAKSKEYYYENLKIIGQPGCEMILNFFTPHVVTDNQYYFQQKEQFKQIKVQDILSNNRIFKSKLKIQFRKCQIGEYYDIVKQICYECPYGQFSFDIREECRKCKDEFRIQECLGGARTVLRNGYWRYSNTSLDIYKCNTSNCVPEKQDYKLYDGNYLCKKGYSGAVCESCDFDAVFWDEHYFQQDINSCKKCSFLILNIIIMVAIMFLKILVVYFMTAKSIQKQNIIIIKNILRVFKFKENKNQYKIKYHSGLCESNEERYHIACSRIKQNKIFWIQQANREDNKSISRKGNLIQAFKTIIKKKNNQMTYPIILKNSFQNYDNSGNLQIDYSEEILANTLFKIIIIQLQVVGFIKQFDLRHFEIINFRHLVGAMNAQQDSYLQLSCVLLKMFKSTPILFKQNVMFNLEPFCIWFLFVLFLWLQKVRGKIHQIHSTYYISSIFILIFLMISAIIQFMIQSILCIRYGDKIYIQQDVNMQCMTFQHKSFLLIFCVPMMTIWLLVFPMGIVYFLYKNKNRLNNKKFKMIYGFIYTEYQYNLYFWEIFKIYLKIVIAFASSLKILGTISQGLIIIIIFGFYMFMIVRYKPHTNKSTNYLDFYNCFLCQMMIALLIMLQISDQRIKYIIISCVCIYMYLFIRFYHIVCMFLFKDLYLNFIKCSHNLYKKIRSMNTFFQKIVYYFFKKHVHKKMVQKKFRGIIHKLMIKNEEERQQKKIMKYIGQFGRSTTLDRNKTKQIQYASHSSQEDSLVDKSQILDLNSSQSDSFKQQLPSKANQNNLQSKITAYLRSKSNIRSNQNQNNPVDAYVLVPSEISLHNTRLDQKTQDKEINLTITEEQTNSRSYDNAMFIPRNTNKIKKTVSIIIDEDQYDDQNSHILLNRLKKDQDKQKFIKTRLSKLPDSTYSKQSLEQDIDDKLAQSVYTKPSQSIHNRPSQSIHNRPSQSIHNKPKRKVIDLEKAQQSSLSQYDIRKSKIKSKISCLEKEYQQLKKIVELEKQENALKKKLKKYKKKRRSEFCNEKSQRSQKKQQVQNENFMNRLNQESYFINTQIQSQLMGQQLMRDLKKGAVSMVQVFNIQYSKGQGNRIKQKEYSRSQSESEYYSDSKQQSESESFYYNSEDNSDKKSLSSVNESESRESSEYQDKRKKKRWRISKK